VCACVCVGVWGGARIPAGTGAAICIAPCTWRDCKTGKLCFAVCGPQRSQQLGVAIQRAAPLNVSSPMHNCQCAEAATLHEAVAGVADDIREPQHHPLSLMMSFAVISSSASQQPPHVTTWHVNDTRSCVGQELPLRSFVLSPALLHLVTTHRCWWVLMQCWPTGVSLHQQASIWWR
jgi:hypothetical protein